MHSSGDLLADRRYVHAEAAFREGDVQAAADLARQTIEIAPRFSPAWFLLGRAREAQYRGARSSDEAVETYRDAVAAFDMALLRDPSDRQGARLRLASLGIGDPLEAMSPDYVRSLFDNYAVRFDQHLTASLKYRAPELLHAAVRRAAIGCCARPPSDMRSISAAGPVSWATCSGPIAVISPGSTSRWP